MAIIIIIATIVLGAKLIGSLRGTACDASDIEFQHDMRKALDTHSVYGSRATLEVSAPCDAREVCFVDSIEVGNAAFTSQHSTITNAIRSGVKRNIFLIRQQGVMDVDYDERIIVDRAPGDPGGGELCVDVNRGHFSFLAEGFGRFVRVSS